MIRFLAVLGLSLLATPAAAQEAASQSSTGQPGEADRWLTSERTALLVPARIAFPRRAGTVSAIRTQEFSHEGEGLDNGLQYRSDDGEVFATIFIYYPGLADAGLASFALDQIIRETSGATVTGGDERIVDAGSASGVAIRRDYGGYRDSFASSAAFIKAERWLVKIRVSGPEARRDEVASVMDTLLAEIRFGNVSRPRPASPLSVTDCPAGIGQPSAELLPDPPGPEIAAHAFLATFDGGGIAATENGVRHDLPSRIARELCVSTRARIGNRTVPILRGTPGEPISVDGQTLLLALLDDSGNTLEIVHAANLGRYVLLGHRIGETTLLGGFDGVPSDDQIMHILTDPADPAGQIRSRVRLHPDGRPQIFLPGPDETLTSSQTD